jgi:hypothetical protein
MPAAIQITVTSDNTKDLAKDLRAIANALDNPSAIIPAAVKVETTPEPTPIVKGKRGRPAKVEAEDEPEELEVDELEVVDDELASDDEPAPTVEDAIEAVQAYAKKHGKDKAVKLVAKFGAKSVRAVKEDKIPALIQAASV